MRLSLNWLESYFENKPDWDLIWSKLTMAGIEVEGIEPVAPHFSGIVVAQVTECIKHPEADKLSLCKVDAGNGEVLQIVCGASNVTAGIKIPLAKIGAVLPDGLRIAERKMRGEISYGMLCSGNEIACPDGVDGLLILAADAPIGVSVRDYLGLDDKIVEFKITPNRGDCLSVQGILREIAALTDYKLRSTGFEEFKPGLSDTVKVVMQAADACPNYLALIIKGINNQVNLPDEITKKLARSGIRNISPVVDITNYVMLELGQPLHAFDVAKVGTQLQVRMAKAGEQLTLLDGREAVLGDNTLLICDSNNQPSAIAGVMGGIHSGISADTQDLILESACFTPAIIAGRAKQYAVNSDAAYRYERGVDPRLQYKALSLAANLIIRHCGGTAGIVTQVSNSIEKQSINLEYSRINRLIGADISSDKVDEILKRLGFQVTNNGDNLTVVAPSYRFDIAIKEDIVEEVARIYGYDNIPPIMPQAGFHLSLPQQAQPYKTLMLALGYSEIVSYAFIEEKYETMLGNHRFKAVKLQNPIAGFNVMRTALFAGLIKTLVSNLNRGHKHIKLFELARVFYSEELQPLKLSGLIYGDSIAPNWNGNSEPADFFDLKRVTEILLSGHTDVRYEAYIDSDLFHSGRCAKIFLGNKQIGLLGQLHPKLGQQLGLSGLPYLFELDIADMDTNKKNMLVHCVSKYQRAERDLAFILDQKIPVGSILAALNAANVDYLTACRVFDVYQGENVANGFKSIAINLVFQGEKTLTDEEINISINKIVYLVESDFQAQLRK